MAPIQRTHRTAAFCPFLSVTQLDDLGTVIFICPRLFQQTRLVPTPLVSLKAEGESEGQKEENLCSIFVFEFHLFSLTVKSLPPITQCSLWFKISICPRLLPTLEHVLLSVPDVLLTSDPLSTFYSFSQWPRTEVLPALPTTVWNLPT